MLGNFSIGAYFKEEAMVLAWNYLTKEVRHSPVARVASLRRRASLLGIVATHGRRTDGGAFLCSACPRARQLCLPTSRLRITVLHSDDESAALWAKITGFSEQAGTIVRLGESDNFWSMGDAAGTPCGPCSEIFWDQGAEVDGDRWLEIWNLVFMQFARGAAPGELTPLARPCVDTGMGLERLASVMQGRPTNYDSDLLRPLIRAVEELALARAARSVGGKRTGGSGAAPIVLRPYTDGLDQSAQSTALKVVVDHLRAASFLIAEGVVPSNVGRGYVLRRIIRRAVRYAHQSLGLSEPFLAALLPPLLDSLGAAYPELVQRQGSIASILTQEETNFFGTLARGLAVLEDAFERHAASAAAKAGKLVLPGEVAFQLYDTFGFPLDLTQVIARERAAPGAPAGSGSGVGAGGWEVDVARFEALMRAQKELSKGAAFQVSGQSAAASPSASGSASSAAAAAMASPLPLPAEAKRWQLDGIQSEFVGFDSLEARDARIVALHRASAAAVAAADADAAGETVWLALDRSPFYANQGGQVGDVGELVVDLPPASDAASAGTSTSVTLPVLDTLRPYEGCAALRVWVSPEQLRAGLGSTLAVGGVVRTARVSRSHRQGVAAHHTATHLLHAALKAVLPTAPAAAAAAEPAAGAGKKAKAAAVSAPTLSAASINQSGSLVAADRLRFDFSCPVALTGGQIAAVEQWVNDAILSAAAAEADAAAGESAGAGATASVRTQIMSKEDAMKMNAVSAHAHTRGSSIVLDAPRTAIVGARADFHSLSLLYFLFLFYFLLSDGAVRREIRVAGASGVSAGLLDGAVRGDARA